MVSNALERRQWNKDINHYPDLQIFCETLNSPLNGKKKNPPKSAKSAQIYICNAAPYRIAIDLGDVAPASNCIHCPVHINLVAYGCMQVTQREGIGVTISVAVIPLGMASLTPAITKQSTLQLTASVV
jgi:hypothetical protein